MRKLSYIALIFLFFTASARADTYEEIKKNFPPSAYLTGYAEVTSSGDSYTDRHRSEILARLEIAKKIKVTIKSRIMDVMCEGQGKLIFDSPLECQNQVSEVVEESVDEMLEGSEIVEAGEDKTKGIFYAVATLPRKKVIEEADEGLKESLEKAKQHLEKAKSVSNGTTQKEEIRKAKVELIKGMVYEMEKSTLHEVESRSEDLFRKLTEEITEVEEEVYPVSEDVKIVTTEGKAIMGEDMTVSQTKAVALNYARRSALEKAVGVNLHSNTLLYNGEIVSDLINSATKGLIVKENVEDKCGEEAGKLYCYARIEAHIRPLKGEKASKIRFIKAIVQRSDNETVVRSPVFQNNDEIQIKVTMNEDSYLNIFSVDQYGNIIKLLPNDYVKPEPVEERKEFFFPNSQLRSMGIKLRVITPKSLSKAIESVLIIATKEEEHFLEDPSIQNPTVTDLMKELSELDQSQWAEKTIGYEVRR